MDIAAKDFNADGYGLTADQVDAALYGICPDGSVTVGMGQPCARLTGWPGWAG